MRRGAREADETPWASFSDALSGMLFVFVITTFWFALRLAVETNKAQETTERLSRDIATLKQAADEAKDLVRHEDGTLGLLATCINDSGYLRAEPERESARVSLYMKDDGSAGSVRWFDPCQAALGDRQTLAAADMRGCVAKVLDREHDKYDVHMFLEGHTDAVAVNNCGTGLVTNWELSGARAAAVTRAVLGVGQADGLADSVAVAVDDHRLQLLAVGLADTRPAWSALCATTRKVSAFDQDVCAALRTNDPATIATALADPGLAACTLPPGGASCAGSSDAAKLCRWANWCPDSDGSLDDRRGLLRRVDLRVELEPRVAAAAATAPGGVP